MEPDNSLLNLQTMHAADAHDDRDDLGLAARSFEEESTLSILICN